MTQNRPEVFGLISDRGWILERLAEDIARTCPNFRYGTEIEGAPDILYYMTYSTRRRPFEGIEVGYFTHIEEGLPAEQAFYETAAEVDHCVTQAALYEAALRARGIDTVTTIPCGIDHDDLRPKLRVGIVGRTYHTGRKGEAMMAGLMDMEDIDFHFTGDGWPKPPLHVPAGKMADFYRSMDYILVPALYEGGPMCVPEALACGTPVIAPDVGWVRDFPHIPYEKGNADDLRRVLVDLAQTGKDLARATAAYTAENWGQRHGALFQSLFERLGDRKAAPGKAAEGLAGARVAQVLHGGERFSQGGPSVRVPYTAERLSDFCRTATLSYGAPDPGTPLDIAHLYNIWQPNTALTEARALVEQGRKVAFSPILLDLSLRSFWGAALPNRLFDAVQGPGDYAAALPQLRADHARARDGRAAALRGYQPVPGFAARLQELMRIVDQPVFLSRFEHGLVEDYCGPIPHGKVLRNPVDAGFFTPVHPVDTDMPARLSQAFGIDPTTPFLLSVGRIEVRKNQLQMAEIARRAERPLILVGHVGSQKYADLVDRTGAGFVHFAGRVEPHSDDLLWLYQNCAAFLSLSWAEGASLSILEAGSSGAPLLLSDTSSEREYVDGLAQFVDPLDVEGALMALDRLIGTLSAAAIVAQHDRIRTAYDWPVHLRALARIYEQMLSR